MKWGRALTALLTAAVLTAGAWAQTKTAQKSGQKWAPSATAKVPDSAKSDSSPSLAETIDWMKQTLEQYGRTEANTSKSCKESFENTLTPASGDPCSIEVAWTSDLSDDCHFPSSHFEGTLRLNLRDLDPAKVAPVVKRSPDSDSQLFHVYLATRGHAAVIKSSSTSSNGHSLAGMRVWDEIGLATQDISERFAKAMKHAVELCSEKKSLF